jgi:hypothetical protein
MPTCSGTQPGYNIRATFQYIKEEMPHDSVIYLLFPHGLKSHGLLNMVSLPWSFLTDTHSILTLTIQCMLIELNISFVTATVCPRCVQIQFCVASACFGIIYTIRWEQCTVLITVYETCKVNITHKNTVIKFKLPL